jgi:IS1 family transposase
MDKYTSCYVQEKDSSGLWFWIYYDSKGRKVAKSLHGFARLEDCEHTINLMKTSTIEPVITVS